MCLGPNEPGGPKYCPSHLRKRRNETASLHHAATSERNVLDTRMSEVVAEIHNVYDEAGVTRNPFAELFDDDQQDTGLTDSQRERIDQLRSAEKALAERISKADQLVRRRSEAADQAQLDYNATPEGVGELTARLDRLALQHADTTDPDGRAQLELQRRRTMRQIVAAEQSMIDQQAARERRWNMRPTPVVRGAQLGVVDSGNVHRDAAAMVAVGTHMSGSYSNTMRADPDAQQTPDSPPEGGAMLRCSRMQLMRETPDGKRSTVVVPIETATDDEHGGPTVTHALRTAISVADSYDDDYSRWAARHGYDTSHRAEWSGSRSYSEGRTAWENAAKVRDGITKFLNPTEYRMISADLRAAEVGAGR